MKRLMTGMIACALGIAAYAVCNAQDAAPKADETKATEPQAAVEQKTPVVCEETCIMRKMDTDKDGKVTLAECIACRETCFKELDTDKDGKLSAEELNACADKHHAEMDANKDGVVVVEEYVAFFAGKDAPKAPADAAASDKLDADGDGTITVGEIVVYRTARFKELDANNDGKVTADELKAYRAKLSSKMDADKCGAMIKDDAAKARSADKKAEEKPAEKAADQPAAQ